MTLTIELTPEQEARLECAARAQGKPAAEIVSELITRLPEAGPSVERASDEAERTRALFAAWEEEDATDDPEEIARRNREAEAFFAAMNANRAETGEEPLYP